MHKFLPWRRKPPSPTTQKPIFVVSGLPRSGTSLMMSMLEAGGIQPLTDLIRQADDDNPRGYYELEQVKKLQEGDMVWVAGAQGKAVKVISALLFYLPEGYTYKILFMRRQIGEILASQRKMLLNRGEDAERVDDEQMSQYFKKHLAQVENWLLNQPHISVLNVDYNHLIQDPTPGVQQINAFLENNLNEERMKACVDPKLYRQRLDS